jgi:hypothetical protein
MKELNIEEIVKLKETDGNRYFIIISSKNPNAADYYAGKYCLVHKEVEHALIKKGQTIDENTFIEHYLVKLDGTAYKSNKDGWIKTNSYAVTSGSIRVFEI